MAAFPSPLWKFYLTALDGTGITDLSKITSDRVCEVVLNAPLTLAGSVPSDNPQVWIPYDDAYDDPYLDEGTRFLFGFRRESDEITTDMPAYYTVRASTIVKLINDEAQQDDARTAFVGRDPWDYMMSRPVCIPDPDDPSVMKLPGADGISFNDTQVAQIIEVLLDNTFTYQGHTFIDVPDLQPNGDVNSGASGFWTGTIEESAGMEIDINFQQGTSVGQAWQQMCNLGVCDIVLKPIYDPVNRPTYLVELNVYAQAGVVNDSAIFAWNLPGRSLVGLSRQQDGSQRANDGVFHAGQGGSAGTTAAVTDAASIAKYGDYFAQQFFPGQIELPAVTSLLEEQIRLRKNGKQTVTFRPAPERSPRPWIDYDLGDRVPVWASPQGFRKLLGAT